MTVIVDNQGYETSAEAQEVAKARYPGDECQIVEASGPAEAALWIAGEGQSVPPPEGRA